MALCNSTTVKINDLKKHLRNIIDKGDPIFVIEFYSGEHTICKLNIKCSLMLTSLESGKLKGDHE